jgi:hypothetical protein
MTMTACSTNIVRRATWNNRDFDRNGKQMKPKPDHMHDNFGPAFNLWLANHESCAKTKT